LVASERGVRLVMLPRATRAESVGAIRRLYPDALLLDEPLLAGPMRAAVPDAGIETDTQTGVQTDAERILQDAARQLRAYFSGTLREFTLPLDLRGHTEFGVTIWSITARIPYGQTRTYGWVARKVGGGAGIFQAVGAALGSNPVPLIIPCHRVLGADGSLHGYAGGLEMKARLLALETGQHSLLA
jgi:methylated-DNA-[protein]-cysteine S-methyltransferase